MEYIAGRPGPHPEFDAPEGLVRGADRPGPVFPRSMWPSLGATYFATLGIAAALRARERTGRGQLVETSLLQGALAAACLNWQRVEDPDAPAVLDVAGRRSRSIEGLYECADGRWVHHWTIRPNWVLAAAEGDELPPARPRRRLPRRSRPGLDGARRPAHRHLPAPAARRGLREVPGRRTGCAAGDAAQMGVALVRSPAEALADESFLADGCVVEVDDPEVGRDPPLRAAARVLRDARAPSPARRPAGASTPTRSCDEAAHDAGRRRHRTGLAGRGARRTRWRASGCSTSASASPARSPGGSLADLGADVIKVHALHDTYWAGTHMGLGTNRGKRSIAVNLKHPAGRAVLDRLLDGADVVTTNWRPGAAARLGLDYETLSRALPPARLLQLAGLREGARGPSCPAPTRRPPPSPAPSGRTAPATRATRRCGAARTWATPATPCCPPSPSPPRCTTGSGPGEGQAGQHVDRERGAAPHVLRLDPRRRHARRLGTRRRRPVRPGARVPAVRVRRRHAGSSSPPCRSAEQEQAAGRARRGRRAPRRRRRSSPRRWSSGSGTSPPPPGRPASTPPRCRSRSSTRRSAATMFDDPDAERDQLVAETWAGAVGRFEDPGLLVDVQRHARRRPAGAEHVRRAHPRAPASSSATPTPRSTPSWRTRAVLDAPVRERRSRRRAAGPDRHRGQRAVLGGRGRTVASWPSGAHGAAGCTTRPRPMCPHVPRRPTTSGSSSRARDRSTATACCTTPSTRRSTTRSSPPSSSLDEGIRLVSNLVDVDPGGRADRPAGRGHLRPDGRGHGAARLPPAAEPRREPRSPAPRRSSGPGRPSSPRPPGAARPSSPCEAIVAALRRRRPRRPPTSTGSSATRSTRSRRPSSSGRSASPQIALVEPRALRRRRVAGRAPARGRRGRLRRGPGRRRVPGDQGPFGRAGSAPPRPRRARRRRTRARPRCSGRSRSAC